MATPGASVSSAPPDRAGPTVGSPGERAALATIAISGTLAPLNSTMIAVALPAIMLAYGASLASAGWLVTSYLVVMAAVQPAAGKLGDQLGRRSFILGGLVGFGLATLGALIAPTLTVLTVFRLLQALGAAIALPNGVALVREVVPEGRRAASFGLIGAVISIAAAAGPPLGGLLVSTAGWQAIFYVNVPIILAALLLGWRSLPRHTGAQRGQPFDLIGAGLLSAVLVGLSLLLRQVGAAPLGASVLAIAGVALLGGLFVYRELHVREPVFHPRFFARRSFSAATAAVALSNLAMYSTLLALPVILTRQAHWTTGRVGLVLTTLSAANVLCAPAGGRLADRFGRRWPVVAGLALAAVAFTPLLWEAPTWSGGVLALTLALAGAGLGIANAGMQTAAVEAVTARQAGAASGMYSTSRYLGSIVGSSVLPLLLTASVPSVMTVQHVFLFVVLAAAGAALASLGLQSRPSAT